MRIVALKNHLKTAREAAGLSQAALAKAVGVNQSTIAQLETGKRQSLTQDSMVKIERALGLRPGSLIAHLPANSAARQLAQAMVPDYGIVWGNRTPADVPEPEDGKVFHLTGRWPPGVFVLKVSGHSVHRYGVHDGDVIAVLPSHEPEEGRLVVARQGNAYTLKGFHEGKLFSFASDDSEPVEMSADEEYQVVGVMVGLVDGDRRFVPKPVVIPRRKKR